LALVPPQFRARERAHYVDNLADLLSIRAIQPRRVAALPRISQVFVPARIFPRGLLRMSRP
jgi:hypothetical protein